MEAGVRQPQGREKDQEVAAVVVGDPAGAEEDPEDVLPDPVARHQARDGHGEAFLELVDSARGDGAGRDPPQVGAVDEGAGEADELSLKDHRAPAEGVGEVRDEPAALLGVVGEPHVPGAIRFARLQDSPEGLSHGDPHPHAPRAHGGLPRRGDQGHDEVLGLLHEDGVATLHEELSHLLDDPWSWHRRTSSRTGSPT